MNKVLFILTTGDYWNSRYYFKQIPALIDKGFDITYMVQFKNNDPLNSSLKYEKLSVKEARTARIFGGLNLLSRILKTKTNLIQICNVELLVVGIILAVFTKKKVLYDCIEDHFNAIIYHKPWLSTISRYFYAYSVKLLDYIGGKLFDGIIASDPKIYSNIYHFISGNKKMIFYNMALKSQFSIISKDISNRCYDLAVIGSMSIRTGVLDVVKTLGILKEEGIILKLKLIGDPSKDDELYQKILKEIDLHSLQTQILITGMVEYNRIPFELGNCKIGIIPLLDYKKFRNNIATKQFEYMFASMPIIATKLEPQTYFIREGFNGLFYTPGDVSELAEKIKLLINNKTLFRMISKNAFDKVNSDWNAEQQQKKFVQFYHAVINEEPYIEEQLPEKIWY